MLSKAFLRFGSLLTMSLVGPVGGRGSGRAGNRVEITTRTPMATRGTITKSRMRTTMTAPIFDGGFDFCLVLEELVASIGAVSALAVASSVSVASRSQGATSILAEATVGAGAAGGTLLPEVGFDT